MIIKGFDSIEDMIVEFDITTDDLIGCNIIVAGYSTFCYEGEVFVLFEKGGDLYEVVGSHCSCYGLEGQWEPEVTTSEAILKRLKHRDLGESYGGFSTEELIKILEEVI